MLVQRIDHILELPDLGPAAKVEILTECRAAPQDFVDAYAAACYCHQDKYAADVPLQDRSRRFILHCSCEHRPCYVVRTVSSLRKCFTGPNAGRDSLLCPAHCVNANTYSKHVQQALGAVLALGYVGPVVWDCHDCTWCPTSHFDLTLLLPNGAKRMEIDGYFHFHQWRLPADRGKDAMMAAPGRSMLRLGYRDVAEWGACISQFCNNDLPGVWYTDQYKDRVDEEVPLEQFLPQV